MSEFTSYFHEVQDFHPLVEQWLTANGYTFIHHYDMPDYGTVDFLATHEDGHQLLVEAKLDKSGIRSGIVQAKSYGVQMPDAQIALAIPAGLFAEEHHAMAEKYGIQIVEVVITDPDNTILVTKLKESIARECRRIVLEYKKLNAESVVFGTPPTVTAIEFLQQYFHDSEFGSCVYDLCQPFLIDGYTDFQIVEAISQWLYLIGLENVS